MIHFTYMGTAAIQDTQRFSPNILFCSPSRFTKISMGKRHDSFTPENSFFLFAKVVTAKSKGRMPDVWLFVGVPHRVARWYIFKPKITIWINCGGS
jgi:hypothetical protein